MTELSIHGAEKLQHVGRALKESGRAGLKKELLRGFREAGKPVVKAIRASAASELPQSGGLAAKTARSSIGVRTRLGGKTVGVRIEGRNSGIRGLQSLDNGQVRHPVFGRGTWVGQRVTPGWFSKPVEASQGYLRGHMQGVLNDVAAKIERSA